MLKVQFEKSVPNGLHLPAADYPEILFIGRSNVGKSSLLNALTQSAGLARSSRTPGRTQMANLFLVEDQVRLVDLPGYGYAKAAKSAIKDWQGLAEAFIRRPSVVNILFLIDCRRLFAEGDLSFLDSIGAKPAVTLIVTKTDKLGQSELAKQKKMLAASLEELVYPPSEIHWVAQKKGESLLRLRKQILNFSEAARRVPRSK